MCFRYLGVSFTLFYKSPYGPKQGTLTYTVDALVISSCKALLNLSVLSLFQAWQLDMRAG